MRKIYGFLSVLLIFTTLACGFNFSTASISNAILAKDPDGQSPTTVFNQEDVFYALVTLNNAPDDTTVKAVWTAVEAEGVAANHLIDEVELTSGDGTLVFDLSNEQLWPLGKYNVALLLNGEPDRTLEFTVEGDATAEGDTTAAQAPEPTNTPEPEPTDTPEPEPTDTPEPEPTATPEVTPKASIGDSLGKLTPTPETEAVAEADAAEPLPFQADPYVHPSDAFEFGVPEGWELIEEDELSAALGDDVSRQGALFVNLGATLTEDEMLTFINDSLDIIVTSFADNYEITAENNDLEENGLYFVTVDFNDGDGQADLFFDQREEIVFVLYFASFDYAQMEPTWDAIIDSFYLSVDAAREATSAATVAPQPTPKTLPPTPIPVNPLAPQAGRSRLYVFNEIAEELTFTIDNQEHKIPPNGIDNPTPIDLNPGKYTYTVSIPGGSVNGEVTLGVDESWSIGVRGDKVVYEPFQVYP